MEDYWLGAEVMYPFSRSKTMKQSSHTRYKSQSHNNGTSACCAPGNVTYLFEHLEQKTFPQQRQ